MLNKIFSVLVLLYSAFGDEIPDVYTLSAKSINGTDVDLQAFRGKVSLFVNVASQCGFTDIHYRNLKKLYDILSYGGKFSVLGFPCNQFGEQEPLGEDAIQEFAVGGYKVEFPMFSKIDVIGENTHPIYKNLIAQSSIMPEWNFYKYLVDHNGKVLDAWGPKVLIESIFDKIQNAINAIPDNEMKATKEEL